MSNPTVVRVDVNFTLYTDGRWTLDSVKNVLRNVITDNIGHLTLLHDDFGFDSFGIGVTVLDQPT